MQISQQNSLTIPWNPHFILTNPLFIPLNKAFAPTWQTQTIWPTLKDYNRWAEHQDPQVTNYNDILIKFVPQTAQRDTFEEGYEPRTYLRGEVLTRSENWHDFFNMLVWLTFPKIKARLNHLQFSQLKQRWPLNNIRTPLENKLTHLDENGVIIICKNVKLITLLREHAWEMLFWQRREQIQEEMRFYVIGHALYEKALHPYIGMTGSSIILQEDANITLSDIDERVSKIIEQELSVMPRLAPLPLLGVPGWWPANDKISFYQNTEYFRPKGKHAR